MGEMRWGGGGGRPDLFGGGGRSDTSEWGASCLHVQKAGKKWCSLCEAHIAQYAPPIIQTIGGAYCAICASHMRPPTSARARMSYLRRIWPYAPRILSNIGGAYSHMRLAYSCTYQHAGPHRICEAHSGHMRLAYCQI